MPKSKRQNRNMNFRETRSERSATASYRNFHKQIYRFIKGFKLKLK